MRSRFILSKDFIDKISHLLKKSTTQIFIDTYHDTAQHKLRSNCIFLINRYLFNSLCPDIWKLKRYSNSYLKDEYTGNETEILTILRNEKLTTQSNLLMEFGISYLSFVTKRYFICPQKIWIDFFGYLTYDEHQKFESDAGIVAMCSITEDCLENEIPGEFKNIISQSFDLLPNKTEIMLYHQNQSLYQKHFQTKSNMNSIFIAQGNDFLYFDQYLGLNDTFPFDKSSSESDDSYDSDNSDC